MVLQEELPPMRESPDMTSCYSLQHVELLDQSHSFPDGLGMGHTNITAYRSILSPS